MQKDSVRYSGTPSIIKRVNRDSIIEIIRREAEITMPAVAAKSGLSLTTVNKIVRELIEEEYVIEGDSRERTVGRPAHVYRLNENREYCLIVYLKRKEYSCFLSNLNGEIRFLQKIRHMPGKACQDELCTLIRTLIEEQPESIGVIGVAVPGTVTDAKITNIPSIEELEGFDLREHLSEQFQLPVVVVNNIKAATAGVYKRMREEYLGLLDMAFLYMGEGVSMGCVINGRPYTSKNNFAGEIGYVRGIAGCGDGEFETTYLQLAEEGDRERIRGMLSHFIHSICCMLDPEVVVVSCPEMDEGNIAAIQEEMRASLPVQVPPIIVLEQRDFFRYVYGVAVMCIDILQKSVNLLET